MQRYIDRYYKAQMSDYIHLPGPTSTSGSLGPTLLSLTPNDVTPDPLQADTRDFIHQKLEQELLEQCYKLLVQMEGKRDAQGHFVDDNYDLGSRDKYDRVSQLPDMVRAEREAVEANRAANRANSEQLKSEWKDLGALLKSFGFRFLGVSSFEFVHSTGSVFATASPEEGLGAVYLCIPRVDSSGNILDWLYAEQIWKRDDDPIVGPGSNVDGVPAETEERPLVKRRARGERRAG